ncbi:MAG: glycosyltransferase [Clostridia bacterium]|nr:glycosyltransferase [Clostridia bacterium]
MKILIVASTMVHINNFHLPYIDRFKKEGNQVYIMANGEGADFNIPFKKCSLSLKNLSLAGKIKKILIKEDFDVVYLHTTLAAFWVRFAMRGLKKRPFTVNTVHGYLFGKEKTLKNKIYLACESFLKNQTDRIIVMNKEDYEIAMANKLSSGDVHFSHGMGVSLSGKTVNKAPKSNDKINLIFVGEISKRKNQEFLVKCMEKLPNHTLTLVGDGDERGRIEKLIKASGLGERVIITGFTKNVYEYIEKADIYVSASKIEGLPFNIMEAMYSKMNIIASDIKGHRDLLPEECLYPLNDEKAFIEALLNASIADREYDLESYKIESALEENMRLYSVERDLIRA